MNWTSRKVLTYAANMLGFPADTSESIARDAARLEVELVKSRAAAAAARTVAAVT